MFFDNNIYMNYLLPFEKTHVLLSTTTTQSIMLRSNQDNYIRKFKSNTATSNTADRYRDLSGRRDLSANYSRA